MIVEYVCVCLCMFRCGERFEGIKEWVEREFQTVFLEDSSVISDWAPSELNIRYKKIISEGSMLA